jgi:hypothetical protein
MVNRIIYLVLLISFAGFVGACGGSTPPATPVPPATLAPAPTAAPAQPTTAPAPTTASAPTQTPASPTVATTTAITPTSAPGAGGATTFAQVGPSLNHDKNSAALDQQLTVGSLDPTKPGVPWATWAEKQSGTQQIFVSKQVGNQFQPVGASLNIHQSVVAEHPSIAFTGLNRAVPWVVWYEPSPTFGKNDNVFASRFSATTGLWQPAGKDRGSNEPSLNIHTNKSAQDPFVVGGSANPANPTVPWVCWQEDSYATNATEIFVSRAVSDTTAIGGFHWQPVGLNRGGSAQDPEPGLNVDIAHGKSEHCVITFAGVDNVTPWVTWEEKSGSNPAEVFVARALPDTTAGAGGFHWEFVPPCKGVGALAQCSLNVNPTKAGTEPYITAGSVVAGAAAAPWMVWTEEGPTGKTQIFVDRLDPASRDAFLNVGGSLNVDQNQDAGGASITFVGNVPYVAFDEVVSGVKRIFIRHLSSDPQTGTWTLDTPQDGWAIDQTKLAEEPVIQALPGGKIVLTWHEGDPDKEASQVVVCSNAGSTSFLPRISGLADVNAIPAGAGAGCVPFSP